MDSTIMKNDIEYSLSTNSNMNTNKIPGPSTNGS